MAIVTIGDLAVDPSIPDLYEFPAVDIPSGVGRMFGLQTLPNPVPLASRAYFLVIPIIEVGNLEVERPKLVKWFPKNRIFNFKFSTPSTLGNPVSTAISLYPITPFGNFSAGIVNCRLFYEDSLNEPATLVV